MAYKDKSVKTQKQNEFIGKAYDRINLLVKKGKKDIIQNKARESGESVNAYINRAIDALMVGGGGYGVSMAENTPKETSSHISHTESLFSESELKQITALLKDGQTVEEYIKAAVLNKLQADTDKANQKTDALSIMQRLTSMSREEQDKAMGIDKKKQK